MSDGKQEFTGGCLCGAVRYRSTMAPLRAVHCHCGMCRRFTGGAFSSWAVFPSGGFAFTRGAPTWRQSSEAMKRGFCNQCGSALSFQYLAKPDFIGVTAGTLDDIGAITPERHFWTDQMAPWLRLDDGLPRLTGPIRHRPPPGEAG